MMFISARKTAGLAWTVGFVFHGAHAMKNRLALQSINGTASINSPIAVVPEKGVAMGIDQAYYPASIGLPKGATLGFSPGDVKFDILFADDDQIGNYLRHKDEKDENLNVKGAAAAVIKYIDRIKTMWGVDKELGGHIRPHGDDWKFQDVTSYQSFTKDTITKTLEEYIKVSSTSSSQHVVVNLWEVKSGRFKIEKPVEMPGMVSTDDVFAWLLQDGFKRLRELPRKPLKKSLFQSLVLKAYVKYDDGSSFCGSATQLTQGFKALIEECDLTAPRNSPTAVKAFENQFNLMVDYVRDRKEGVQFEMTLELYY